MWSLTNRYKGFPELFRDSQRTLNHVDRNRGQPWPFRSVLTDIPLQADEINMFKALRCYSWVLQRRHNLLQEEPLEYVIQLLKLSLQSHLFL